MTAQYGGAALYKRSKWRKELEETKIDMGLRAPYSDAELDSSLIDAMAENNYRAMRDMAQMGADVNLIDEETRDTLLHAAVRGSSLKTVIALLQLGADPFARNAAGETARDIAQARHNGGRFRTVLKLWEIRRSRAANDDLLLSVENLLRSAS